MVTLRPCYTVRFFVPRIVRVNAAFVQLACYTSQYRAEVLYRDLKALLHGAIFRATHCKSKRCLCTAGLLHVQRSCLQIGTVSISLVLKNKWHTQILPAY